MCLLFGGGGGEPGESRAWAVLCHWAPSGKAAPQAPCEGRGAVTGPVVAAGQPQRGDHRIMETFGLEKASETTPSFNPAVTSPALNSVAHPSFLQAWRVPGGAQRVRGAPGPAPGNATCPQASDPVLLLAAIISAPEGFVLLVALCAHQAGVPGDGSERMAGAARGSASRGIDWD